MVSRDYGSYTGQRRGRFDCGHGLPIQGTETRVNVASEAYEVSGK